MNEHAESTAQLLDAAADLLETGGWCQGRYEATEGRCILGALSRAAIDTHARYPRLLQADCAVRDKLQADGLSSLIALFNDTDGRTQFECIDLLRHTAKDVRNGDIIPPAYG